MNKKEIISKLSDMQLDKNKIIVISGASLVVQNIIESTNDIDLTCDRAYYDLIAWPTKMGSMDKEIKYMDVFEISNNLFHPDRYIMIDDFKYMTLVDCLKLKEMLNRTKDQEVIRKLRRMVK